MLMDMSMGAEQREYMLMARIITAYAVTHLRACRVFDSLAALYIFLQRHTDYTTKYFLHCWCSSRQYKDFLVSKEAAESLQL